MRGRASRSRFGPPSKAGGPFHLTLPVAQPYHPGSKPFPMKRSSKAGRSRNAEVVVPDKLYFRIGEVARLCRLPTYVLRFWEKEFPALRPNKSSSGQRMYRRREVETALRIKHLLYEDGFTIAGARLQLRAESRAGSQDALPFATAASRKELLHVRQGLKEVLGILAARR